MLYCSGADGLLFTENETNNERLYGVPSPTPYVKDAFHAYVVNGKREAVNPAATGTKAAARYRRTVGAGETINFDLRLISMRDKHPLETPFSAAFVRLKRAVNLVRVRRLLPAVGPDRANGISQRPAAPSGISELRSQLREPIIHPQVSARPLDLVEQHSGKREVLEDCHDVGKRLVKGKHIAIRGVHQPAMQPIENRMRRFMSDNVVRQTREGHAAGHAVGGQVRPRGKVSEEERLLRRIVVRVLLPERVGIDAQALHGHVVEGPGGGGDGAPALSKESVRRSG